MPHAPGPWHVNPQTPTTVMTPSGRISVSWQSNRDDGTQEMAEATARLVADAPELLAMLERVRQGCVSLAEIDVLIARAKGGVA